MTVAGEDVELERGARLGALRRQLAEILGRAELLGATFVVGTQPLDDDALVGFGPLVAGAEVRVHVARRRADGPGPGPVELARMALAAHARWEVVAGPDAGLITTDVARATHGLVTERRPWGGREREPGTGGAARQRAGRSLRVRRRLRNHGLRPRLARQEGRPRRTRGPRVTLVRDHAPDRTVRLGILGRRVRHGDVLTIRTATGSAAFRRIVATVEAERAALAAEESGRHGRGRSRSLTPGLSVTTLVVPLVSAAMLAVVTNRPAFALVGLVGPLALGVTALVRRRHRARPTTDASPASWGALASAPVELTARVLGAAGPPEAAEPPPVLSGVSDPRPSREPRALAASGPLAQRRARSAVLAFAALFPGAPVRLVGGDPHAWEWARWLGAHPAPLPASGLDAGSGSPGGTGSGTRDSPELVVVTLTAPADLRRASEWWASASAGVRVVLVAPDGPPTAWCEGEIDGPGLGADLADALGRALAPHVAHGLGAARAATVPLADLLGLDTTSSPRTLAHGVGARWERAPASPAAVVGRLADATGRAWSIDLAQDGPHGLVAGTTGAGKSELLQTLVLSLALTHPPERLTFVLLDHKGGAGFGPCLTLPHVAGVATDLEPGSARRALAALRAELREREELCARHGVPDVDTLAARGSSAYPPRILVVVDELRALADDDPDLVPSFLRIAAQGRSLGLHLILATQRPAGAVSADVRANVGLRVALRVSSDADSRDVVEVPDAASLPASAPGKAVVVTSRSAHRTVQCALASAPSTRASARVRRVPRTPGPPRLAAPGWGADAATRLVAAAGEAAALGGVARATPLWVPPLPGTCHADDGAPRNASAGASAGGATGGAIPLVSGGAMNDDPTDVDAATDAAAADAAVIGGPAQGLPVALLDVPDERRRSHAIWETQRGHLHVEGAPGSGRSTTLRALALEAAHRGWHVHVLGPDALVPLDRPGLPADRLTGTSLVGPTPPTPPSSPTPRSDPAPPSGPTPSSDPAPPPDPATAPGPGMTQQTAAVRPHWFGTHAPASDPRRAHALLARLLAVPPARPTLVLVDGVEEVLAALARINRGAGGDTLVALARQPAAHRVRFVLASSRGLVGPLASTLGPRLVFTGTDRTTDLGRGVPGTLAGLGGRPGRGVWTGAGPARLAQAFLPRRTPPAPRLAESHAPLRIAQLPAAADARARDALTQSVAHAAHRGLAPLGHGGDDAGPRTIDITRDVLVTGPPGSGRTTVLARLARHAAGCGPVVVVGACAGLAGDPRLERVPLSAEGLAALADLVGSGGWTVVIDDVDVLARLLPAEHDRAAAIRGADRFIVSSTTTAAMMASRGILARVRAGRHGIVLDPGRPGSADVLAADVTEVTEPGPCPAGRGALVAAGHVELVQCLAPDDG